MDELLREFLTETAENLDHVDAQLVRFEREPNNGQVLSNIFRLVHTIKRTCGFLGLPRLEARSDDQGRDDGKRERDFDNKARSAAGNRFHIHRAADLLDISAHDIHPDAAAGNAGHLRSGRKPWSEDKIVDLSLRFCRNIGLADETRLKRRA